MKSPFKSQTSLRKSKGLRQENKKANVHFGVRTSCTSKYVSIVRRDELGREKRDKTGETDGATWNNDGERVHNRRPNSGITIVSTHKTVGAHPCSTDCSRTRAPTHTRRHKLLVTCTAPTCTYAHRGTNIPMRAYTVVRKLSRALLSEQELA